MKIAIIGAYGKTGRAVIQEALRRGHTVLPIAHRKHDQPTYDNLLIKDLMNLTKADLAGVDAVIDAVSAWTPASFPIHTTGISHMAHLLAGTPTRYLKVGGAGTLYTNSDHTEMLKDREDYPQNLLPLANALVASLTRLRSYSSLAWTYVTPAHNYDATGKATGIYHVDGEEYLAQKDTDSYISYADYATGMLDILEQGTYIRQRITLIGGTK